MSDWAGPAPVRQQLASQLRQLRGNAGRTIQEVAQSLECSSGKVSRIEAGSVGARLQDVRVMLDLYGVTGVRREALLDLVREARRRPWWVSYADVLPPASGTLYGLERSAHTIEEHSAALIPGLLQTQRYAQALIDSPPTTTPVQARRRVELRMRRQDLLNRGGGPDFQVIIGEAALREPVGGPAVMAEQLHHLVAMSNRPRITIRIRPFGTGRPAAIGTSFVIFRFEDPRCREIVYLEHPTRNAYLDETTEVSFYTSVFADARKRALTPAESCCMFSELAAGLSRTPPQRHRAGTSATRPE